MEMTYFVTNFHCVGDEGEVSCVKMADKVVVDWSHEVVSKSTEQIEAKKVSLESFLKTQDN